MIFGFSGGHTRDPTQFQFQSAGASPIFRHRRRHGPSRVIGRNLHIGGRIDLAAVHAAVM